MRKNQLRLGDYMQHILDAIARIDSYIEDCDEVTFSEVILSVMLSYAILR